ncbi:geranylgeranyl pyrophosphate synthetase [Botrytis cinerea]
MAPITISEISRTDLQEFNTPASASITDVKQLSSYNWLEAPQDTPTIAIPGSPALWSTLGVSPQVKKDSGVIYIAQNAARHPESPLEPLFRTLYFTHPSFDICPIDVVTDRNNIRKLLSFVDPSSTRNGLEEFTINIEITKNTALFCREEDKNLEYIGPHEFRGFGHEFEKAYTVTKIRGSTGHHRIISYRFSDLNFIVRHETDGYINTDTKMSSSKTNLSAQDGLSSMLDALSLSPVATHPNIIPTGSKMTIKEEGQVVPLESTLEIKTRVSHKPLNIEEIAPQLWVSQTPKLVRAHHQKGTFQNPVVEDIAAKVKSWEARKQDDLRKLAALIKMIINLVKECGGNAVVKYNAVKDKLVLFKVERKEMLPKDLYSKWDNVYNLDEEIRTQDKAMQEPEITRTGQKSMSTVRFSRDHDYSANVEPLQIKTTGDDHKTTIKIGGAKYDVNVSKIPYLESYTRLQKASQPQATEIIHEPINLFDVAFKGIESGYRQCFRCLSTDLSQYRTLFQTYKFLAVDILSNLSIDQVIANLKVGKSNYDLEERRRIPGNKSLARDAAFQLLYLILHPQYGNETKDKTKLFNAVMFVVSHPGTFKYCTKRMIRVAYEEQFGLTFKQRPKLDQWENGETANFELDVTTEEEPDYYFSSDDDSF